MMKTLFNSDLSVSNTLMFTQEGMYKQQYSQAVTLNWTSEHMVEEYKKACSLEQQYVYGMMYGAEWT